MKREVRFSLRTAAFTGRAEGQGLHLAGWRQRLEMGRKESFKNSKPKKEINLGGLAKRDLASGEKNI